MIFAAFICSDTLAQQVDHALVNPAFEQFVATGQSVSQWGYAPPVLNLSIKKYPEQKGSLALPATYDLRSTGNVTSVKNQGACGACWAFATCASTESYWLIQGEGTNNLSEDNMNNCHDFDWAPCNGGNVMIATAYLSRGSGMMSETSDPYNDAAGTCPTNINPLKYVSQCRYVPKNNTTIKQAIYDYGALYTCYMHDDAYYNTSTNSYYYSGTDAPNHAVTLVGWDDTKVTSGGTGAWIVKNSWGTSWGNAGYFYISYNDAAVNEEVGFFPGYRDFSTGDQVLSYAKFGEINDIGFGSNTAYGLIKYSASSNMIIKTVGTYIASGNSTVSIEIYDDFNGTTLSNLLDTIGMKSCGLPGYYSFDLSTPVALVSGNDVYIKVNYSTPGYNYPIPVEEVYSGFASNVTLETGKCWVSGNGSTWNAAGAGTSRLYDLCINLYTSTAGAVTSSFVANSTSTCTGAVQFTDQSSNSPTNWLWTFGDGNSSTLQHPQHYYTSDGVYTVKLKSWNVFGSDSLTRTSYITVGLPSAPVGSGTSVCAGQQATLNASGSGTIEWYDAQFAGNYLGSGNSFTTPVLTYTTSYYAQNGKIPGASLYVGDLRYNTNGGMFTSAYQHYLVFDCNEACKLVSVQVNAGASGYRLIQLMNSSGNVLQDTNINIPSGAGRITLNFDIPAESGLRLVAPVSPNLYRNDNGCAYPYSISPYISITSSSASTNPTGYYYFFYNWEVKPYCSSARTEIEAIVSGPQPELSMSGNVSLCPGDSVTVSAQPADTYVWYPNGETTQSISVSQAGTYYALLSGSSCNVNSDTLVVSMLDLPTSGFTSTINEFNVSFTSLSQNASSWFWDFGDGSFSGAHSPAHLYATAGNYLVEHYAINECDSALHQETIALGVSGLGTNEIPLLVYPLPANDYVMVQPSGQNIEFVSIFSADGRQVLQVENHDQHSLRIDLSMLETGIYFLKTMPASDEIRILILR